MTSDSNLVWRCRRGIREMDILLQQFLEKRYELLTDQEKHAFRQMLDEPDLDILNWITGRDSPPSSDLVNIIQHIRELNSKT